MTESELRDWMLQQTYVLPVFLLENSLVITFWQRLCLCLFASYVCIYPYLYIHVHISIPQGPERAPDGCLVACVWRRRVGDAQAKASAFQAPFSPSWAGSPSWSTTTTTSIRGGPTVWLLIWLDLWLHHFKVWPLTLLTIIFSPEPLIHPHAYFVTLWYTEQILYFVCNIPVWSMNAILKERHHLCLGLVQAHLPQNSFTDRCL